MAAMLVCVALLSAVAVLAAAQNLPVTQANLQGNWQTVPCNNVAPGVFAKGHASFSGANFGLRVDIFTSGTCSTRLAYNQVNGTYTIGAQNSTAGVLNTAGLQPYNVNLFATTDTLVIIDPGYLAAFQSTCSQPSAQMNVVINVQSLSCPALGFLDESPSLCPNGDQELLAISNGGNVLQPGLRTVPLCQTRSPGLDPVPLGKVTSHCGLVQVFSTSTCTGTPALQSWFPNAAQLPCQLLQGAAQVPCANLPLGATSPCSAPGVIVSCPAADPVLPSSPGGTIVVTAWPLSSGPNLATACSGNNIIIRTAFQTGVCFPLVTRTGFSFVTYVMCGCTGGAQCTGYSDPQCSNRLTGAAAFSLAPSPLSGNNCQLDPSNAQEYVNFQCSAAASATVGSVLLLAVLMLVLSAL
jgi:hypothetical protein